MTDGAKQEAQFDDAYDRLCEAVGDPKRTRANVRAQDLRIILTELNRRVRRQ
jgi:hypothetical protein